jgi:hypothetical protein
MKFDEWCIENHLALWVKDKHGPYICDGNWALQNGCEKEIASGEKHFWAGLWDGAEHAPIRLCATCAKEDID